MVLEDIRNVRHVKGDVAPFWLLREPVIALKERSNLAVGTLSIIID